jgi:hypothetical protein
MNMEDRLAAIEHKNRWLIALAVAQLSLIGLMAIFEFRELTPVGPPTTFDKLTTRKLSIVNGDGIEVGTIDGEPATIELRSEQGRVSLTTLDDESYIEVKSAKSRAVMAAHSYGSMVSAAYDNGPTSAFLTSNGESSFVSAIDSKGKSDTFPPGSGTSVNVPPGEQK